jgi:hypothetical protein
VVQPEESRESAALGLISIDRKGLIVASAGMDHMVLAAAERPAVPGIDQVEGEGGMNANGGVQARGGIPGLISNTRHIIPLDTCRLKGQW